MGGQTGKGGLPLVEGYCCSEGWGIGGLGGQVDHLMEA